MDGNHSVFGRYMTTLIDEPPAYQGGWDNLLKTVNVGADNSAHSVTLGDTLVLGSAMVNAFRFAFNRTRVNRFNPPYLDPSDVGIKLYPYYKGQMPLNVTGAFQTAGGANTNSLWSTTTIRRRTISRWCAAASVRFGANVARAQGLYQSTSSAAGTWLIDGRATGLGLADFLLGRVTTVEHGAVQNLPCTTGMSGSTPRTRGGPPTA